MLGALGWLVNFGNGFFLPLVNLDGLSGNENILIFVSKRRADLFEGLFGFGLLGYYWMDELAVGVADCFSGPIWEMGIFQLFLIFLVGITERLVDFHATSIGDEGMGLFPLNAPILMTGRMTFHLTKLAHFRILTYFSLISKIFPKCIN